MLELQKGRCVLPFFDTTGKELLNVLSGEIHA